MPNRIDMTGWRFGRLAVVSPTTPTKGSLLRWNCICDCGKQTTVRPEHLRGGRTTSCGCFHREQLSRRVSTHRRTNTFEYHVWVGIKQRCLNPAHARYKRYGGRGITVCSRWADSFEAFFSDMGAAPSHSHSIDRIDNDSGYEPINCRWSTPAEQARNQSSNRMLTYRCETLCVADWSTRLGIGRQTIYKRLRLGWSVEQALCTPTGVTPA